MAITCALGDKHIGALTKVIAKSMLNALEAGKAFDVNNFMNDLYSKIKEKQGVDNAIQYMQQVPYITNRILAKLEDLDIAQDVDGNETNLRALSKTFRSEDGIQVVANYFEKTLTPEDLLLIAQDNAEKPEDTYEEPEEEAPVENYGDERLKARSIYSGTHEEFIAKSPGESLKDNTENIDKDKLHIINAIGRISNATRNIDLLDRIALDGVELYLKVLPLSKLSSNDRTQYSNDIVRIQNALVNEGKNKANVTPISEQFTLVLTNAKGEFVYFSKNGTVTTKDAGGRIVYQMLRDVRYENNKYRVTDIYGEEDQIISPLQEATTRLKEQKISVKELEAETGMSFAEYVKDIEKTQQEEFKRVYDFRQKLIATGQSPILNLTGASIGVINYKVADNITLNKLDIFSPETSKKILESIQNLDAPFKGFESGRSIVQINGEVIEVDRSDIQQDLAKKIAAVLANPKFTAKEKIAFYNQFYTDQKVTVPTSTQRHDFTYRDGKLIFSYVPFTSKEAQLSATSKKANEKLLGIDLKSATAEKDIFDILMSGKSAASGTRYPSKIIYKTSLIGEEYFDYEDGAFVLKNYVDFLAKQDGKIKLQGNKTIPLFNAYVRFTLDNAFIKRVNKAKAIEKEKEDLRSETRKFKDNLVKVIKASPNKKVTATVVREISETQSNRALALFANSPALTSNVSTYNYVVTIEGQEGEHTIYGATNKPVIGSTVDLSVSNVEVSGGRVFVDVVNATKLEGGNRLIFGNLAEKGYEVEDQIAKLNKDFNAKYTVDKINSLTAEEKVVYEKEKLEKDTNVKVLEAQRELKREPVLLADVAAEIAEREALDEVTVAPKVVSKEESEIQVVEGITPTNTENPADETVISEAVTKRRPKFNLDRSKSLSSSVTEEQIDNAIDWYGTHPLSKFLGLPQMVNIVNSDAYARFIAAGSTLVNGQYLGTIQINKATGGTMVDVYHEAWHAFSQLFLTKDEKIALYEELRASNSKYEKYSFLELEELLAEDFRSYALNQKATKGSPKRNTLFRRILNFLKKLFKIETSIADELTSYDVESEGIAGELFSNLYLAGTNPDLLNIYTPTTDNVMFDILNRGIEQDTDKNEFALNTKDSDLINETIDSSWSDLVDENYKYLKESGSEKLSKAGTTKIFTKDENKVLAYGEIKELFKEKLADYKSKLKVTPKVLFSSLTTLENLEDNASAIIRSKNGDNIYIFLKSQVEDFSKLNLATEGGERIKGELYKEAIEVIGDFYTHDSIKDESKENATVLIVDTPEEGKAQYDAYVEGGEESFTGYELNPVVTVTANYNMGNVQSRILNNVRILESALKNWESVIKYHKDNSTYDVLQNSIEIEETKEGEDAATNITNSVRVKSEIGKETLMQLGGKEVMFILKSLHKKSKKIDGNYAYEYNALGAKKLVNFKEIWNTLVKVTASTKDPQKIYDKIVAAAVTFPELQQLIDFKLPNPNVENNTSEFDITSSFWSVFSLPRVPLMQLSLFDTENGFSTEVTSGSLDTKNVVKKFQSNFKSNKTSKYVFTDSTNNVYLNLNKVVDTFGDRDKNFNDDKAIEFLDALGITLDKNKTIEEEITNLNNRTYYGLPYLYNTIKAMATLENTKPTDKKIKDLIVKFKIDPVGVLKAGIPKNIIGAPDSIFYKDGSKQNTQIERIAEVQINYGSGVTSFSSSNAAGDRVNEHTTDNTFTVIIDALNTAENRTDMYKAGSVLKYLEPKRNPMAKVSQVLKNLFQAAGPKKSGRSISTVLVSGTQRTEADVYDGQNTTSLSEQGKLLQDMHTMLKAGMQEIMRAEAKSSSWGWMFEGGFTAIGGRKESYLYADIDSFVPRSGGERAVIKDIILPYLSGEVEKINIFKTNPEAKKYIGYNRKANSKGQLSGEIFNYFNGVITDETQKEILKKVTDPNVSLLDYLNTDPELFKKINIEIYNYFENKSNEFYDQISKAKFFDHKLLNKLEKIQGTLEQKERILSKAFYYNSWIHNMETSILFLGGDISQFDHSKKELNKRLSGLISNGPRIRTDIAAQLFLSDKSEGGFSENTYASTLPEGYDKFKYDGYLNTAVMEDIRRTSIYAEEIRRGLTRDLKKRNPKLSDQEVSERVSNQVEKYTEKDLVEGDGQGYITFDAYRLLKKAQNKWSVQQENLYKKIVAGEEISVADALDAFPVYKLQNFGFVEDTVLPVLAMHKFALMPLIPSVIKGKELENLHKQMLKNNVQYATFASGSKIGGVSSTTDGKVDQVFEEGGRKLKKDIVFTKNRIHGAYIKEAASVPSKLKGKVIFSTQLRKLVLEGLKEYGVAVSPLAQELTDTYEGLVNFYSDLLKKDLENEIGYRKDANGTYIGNPAKFLKLIQINLKAKDYPKHLIESLKVNSDGTLNYDLSYFIDSKSIESVVMSIVNTKLIKQKINGEALVQVASSMWNSSAEEELAIKFDKLTPEENEAARKKYLGTNTFLPFYTVGPDGKTLPMKVAISLQGDFNNLLNLKHNDGQAIGTRERLNQMIKNEEWLGKGDNRKSITLDAVRIPVQGLNSMEFMEVYEFLDPAAHTMIILPTEIVAKSGGDFDVDKLTTFFPNIDKDGNYIKSTISNANFFAEIARLESEGKSVSSVISLQKKAVENEMIQAIKAILEIEDNYAALVTPNSTEILKDEADMLEEFVSSRDIYAKVNGDSANISAKNKKMISPTSVLEPLFNASVHRANLEGKDVLSLAANDNTFNTLLTSIGAKMPLKYKASKWNKNLNRYIESGDAIYDMRLFLPHNKIDGHISLSTISTEDALYKISDVISQGMNGWLDVGKDAWIFYIQGNLETSPVLLYLVKAGVPVKDAIYFVSNPLIREYTERQTLGKGVYAGPTGMGSKESVMVPYESAVDIFDKHNNQFISDTLSKIPTNKTLTIGVTEEDPFGRPIIVEQELTKESVLENLYSLNIAYIADGETRIFQEVKPSTAKIYDSSDFLSKIPGVLKNGNFDRKEMLDIIQERGELKGKNLETSFAILAHFIEIEKQIKGLAALKRSAKFDAKTLRSPQELVLKNLNIDLLFDNSKIDPETARKLLKESIISSFGDQSIIEEIFMPMMPLKNGDKINTFISNVIGGYSETQKSRINEIFKTYGTSSEAINNFMSAYKDAVSNFIFQNYLSNMIDKKGNIVSVPTEFNKQEVKIDLSLPTDVEIRDGVFIVNSKRIRQDFTEKKYLATDNEVNNYSSREGLEAFTESNDVFPTEESYFKYVLEREYLFNKGLRGTELNQEALMNVFNYASIMLPGKYSFTDQVLEVINKHKKTLSRGYGIIEQIRGYVEKSDLNLLTLSDRDVLTGDTATSYATELKALANPRIQKVADPEENLKISKLFALFPLMMVYQHGYGQTIAGFELALPTEKVLSKMKAAGALFKNNYDNAKTYNLIFDKLVASKSRFNSYVVTAEQYNQYKPEVPEELKTDDSALDPENEVNIPIKKAITSTISNPADFTNHSGGATGGDMVWDAEGRSVGVTNHKHYTVASYDKLDNQSKAVINNWYLETVKFLGRGVISADSPSGKLVRRDMLQANNGDGVFGVTDLIKPGTKGRKGYDNKMSYSIPEGGTGYAIARGIQSGKPVYVFNQSDDYGNEIGWYKWNDTSKDFIKTDTPILTKNFTGIGTREINEAGKQAIKDVYENTFKSTTQPSTSVEGININTKSSDKLGRELTNPNWGAKNIMDIEAEYKANASKIKAPELTMDEALKYDMNLMYKLQMKKFKAHPELIQEITDRGGVKFLEASEHTVGVKGSRWEGKGINSNFIKVLIKSYEDSLGTTQSSTIPKIVAAPITEVKTTDQYKYFGSMYTIKLDNGIGVDVEGYKGKPDAKAKLLNAYNENPNVDPQNGREFRQTYTAPVESAIPGEYSFTFANGFVIDTPFLLNSEQQSALLRMEDFLNDSEKYNNEIALIGYAGTGKTTIISLFDKYIRSKGGRRPKYSSPTHRANAVTKMNNPNANVQTLHKLFGLQPQLEIDKLGELSLEDIKSKQTNQVNISGGDLLIIDESSMISDTLYQFIRDNKEKLGIKVIYLGDPAQLAPVDKTKKTALSVALETPFKMNLTKVERTNDNPILFESTALREGKPLSMVSAEVNGRGVEYISNAARTNQVIATALEEMVISKDYLHFRLLSGTNANVNTLNDKARKILFNADSSTGIQEGEILMGYDNFDLKDDDYTIFNSGDYLALSVSAERTKSVNLLGDEKATFVGNEVLLQSLLEPDKSPKSVFIAKKGPVNTEAGKKLLNAKVELIKLANSAPTRQLRGMYFSRQFDILSQVALMEPVLNSYGTPAIKATLNYGYAHTIHKSQGGTYSKVLILLDSINNTKFDPIVKQQLKYVAVSRATDYVYVVTGQNINTSDTDFDTVTPSTDDKIISSFKVPAKTSTSLPMKDDNITKIFNGTKVVTNRTGLFADGTYVVGGVQEIELKYLGEGNVVGNNVIIVNPNTKKSFIRTKDEFAKADGFKNWKDFETNESFSKNFIAGRQSRNIYSVKPLGEIKEVVGANQSLDPENNPAIAAFNQELIKTNGIPPKVFTFQNGPYTNKYVLTKNNLYNLVDKDNGSIFVSNINLQTGEIVNDDLPSTPVDKQKVERYINDLKKQIKDFRIDEILADKGIDINEVIDNLENVSTEDQFNEIASELIKNMC